MPIHRKPLIKQTIGGDMHMPAAVDGDIGPMHREMMTELRAIHAQMANPDHSAATATDGASILRDFADAHALLETYAQIEECKNFKAELDLIRDAISRIEQATQQMLGAAEAIDQAASALARVNSPDQQQLLSEELHERVVSIFEACNFQNLRPASAAARSWP